MQIPDSDGPLIRITIRTFEPDRAGTIPIGVFLPPAELEQLRNYRVSTRTIPGPAAFRELIEAVLRVYDMVRERWIQQDSTSRRTVKSVVEFYWDTPVGEVKLSRCSTDQELFTRQVYVRFHRCTVPAIPDYAPEEHFPNNDSSVTAAEIVAAWGQDPARTPQELELARGYLSRWAEGPQWRLE